MRSHRQSLRVASTMLVQALVVLSLALLLIACGAKTGLDTPDVEAGPDVGVDAADASDIPLTPRTVRCDPVRIRTRLGFVASIRPDTDVLATMGVTWTIDTLPTGSRASILTDGSLLAAITPDQIGEYDLTAQIPTPFADGGHLACSVVVIAEPPDPQCPGYAITEPRPVDVPGGDIQVAYDIVYHDPHAVSNGSTGAIVADDVTARVSTLAIEQPTTENLGDLMGALAAEGERAEARVTSALGATEVLVGRSAITHDQHPLRRSTLRVDTGTTTPGDLRDRALQALTSLSPPAETGPAQSPASQFYVEIVTIVRQDTARVVTLVAVSPVAAFDDITTQTAIRVNDFANGTAVARTGATLSVRCHAVTATRSVQADFLWLVDTSGSMYDDQERVGSTAERFFADLRLAGVDFRVGVFQAGHTQPRLTGPPAFQWISGNDTNGAREMAFQVTELQYMSSSLDTEKPFRVAGGDEEPLAAAVEVIKEFERRRAIGETNPNFVLRPGAAVVTFLVTDEDGNNDYSRYFDTGTAPPPMMGSWGADPPSLVSNITQFFTVRGIVPFGLVPVFPNAPCPSIANLVECVITRASGAFIPINVADSVAQAQVEAAMGRIVDTVAGAASEFVLPIDPISASLRARVDGRLVPRSRADGFDYEERARSLVFRGATYRPSVGQEVRTAYFVWCDGSTPGC